MTDGCLRSVYSWRIDAIKIRVQSSPKISEQTPGEPKGFYTGESQGHEDKRKLLVATVLLTLVWVPRAPPARVPVKADFLRFLYHSLLPAIPPKLP